MPSRLDEHATGVDLYRALQDHKTDDVPAVRDVLARHAREHRASGSSATRRPGHVVELCAGRGRLIGCYPPDWTVTCVDLDQVALAECVRRRPDTRAVFADLRRPVELPLADVVVCAHNSANEIGDLRTLLRTASRTLVPGGSLFLDLVVGDAPYPSAHLRTAVRRLQDDDRGTWLLHSQVFPSPEAARHTLVLVGTLLDRSGRVRHRLLHAVDREVYPEPYVTRVAAENGLVLIKRTGQGRFLFACRGPVSSTGWTSK